MAGNKRHHIQNELRGIHMIKLVLTDMDGTFLNENNDYNRPLYKEVKELM